MSSNDSTTSSIHAILKTSVTGTCVAIGGAMEHNYHYDNLYRLDSASGAFVGANGKKANYSLAMGYDNMHNITRKRQDVVQQSVKFDGILNAGYDLSYTYAGNSQQIANIADASYRAERSSGTYATGSVASDSIDHKTHSYRYDANGNLLYVGTGKKINDSTLLESSTRRLLWDEDNRLLAISDNGYVSNYWYDASGERAVKQSGGSEGVFVNGVLSAARTQTSKFTAYVSPYLVVSNGGNYSKHIYVGSQRITSKLSNSLIFDESRNPLSIAKAKASETVDYAAKFNTLTGTIAERFDSLGVIYKGTVQSGGLITQGSTSGVTPQYFYHPDHLGSSSLITDQDGLLGQHIQYVPFGEVFVEERTTSWSTPYKFNAKELDPETGLYYYGARYYDPRTSVWLSVDPLAEKMPNWSSYVYTFNNPIYYNDPDGKQGRRATVSGAVLGWLIPPPTANTPLQIMQKDRIHVKIAHSVLDVGGTAPGFGEPFDALNGLLYYIEGEKLKAGLSWTATIPIFGWAATSAKWISNGLSSIRKVDVKAINRLFEKAPYNEAFDVIEGVTKKDTKFVRVHGENNKLGGWMMDASDIKGLSPQQIQDKFALPELPTQVSDVLVPSGTQVRIGVAGKVDGWGNGGGVQVQALQDIPQNAFTNTRKLE